MRPNKCTNVLLASGTLFIVLLTCAEIGMPIVSLVLAAIILTEEVKNPFFGNNELLLFIGTVGVLASSAVLLIVFISQLCCPLNKVVACFRHAFNVIITAFAILTLLYVRTSAEDDARRRIENEWGNENSLEFQRRYECVSAADCIVPLRHSFDKIYTTGRLLTPILGVFWAVIIFYGIVGVLVAIVSRKIKIV